jgi:hypothetical protein
VDEFGMSPFWIPVMIFMIPITAIFGGFVYLVVRTLSRARVRELEIRERIAMIERGLVPAPETDPRGFERAMARHEIVLQRRAPSRFRGAGIIVMGAGMALIVLIGFAGGEPGAAIGVGGAIVVLGLAFFVASLFGGGDDLPPLGRYPSPPPPPIPPASPAPAQAEQRLD